MIDMMTLALLESEKKTKTDLQFDLVALQEEQNKIEKSPTENVEKLNKGSHADSIYGFADRKQRWHANLRIDKDR